MAELIETLNMRSATIDRVMRQIKNQLEDKDYTPVSIIGKSGIGKTESISNLASELGIEFKEVRLSHYMESDLVGLPYIENGITKHAPTDLLPPTDSTKQGILLLDEITSSQKSMRSAVYQLMDSSRKLGQYVLPKNWLIVACGNGPNDGGDFRGIEPAFMSRGFCWRMEANLSSWKSWALKRGVHPTVIAFLTFMPEKLHVMDPDAQYDMIACPRNWVKLSTQLKNMEKRTSSGIIEDDDDLEFSSAGCVGANCGPTFSAFYRYNKEVINPQDILDGKVPADKMRSVNDEVLYITAENIVHLASNEIKAHKNNSNAGVDDVCLKKIANLMKWVISLPTVGVHLDVALTIAVDLATSIGDDFSAIMMAEEFDEICPEMAQFYIDNLLVTSAL